MKKILFLTNPKNDSPEEDKYLIEILKKDFEIIVSHPLECKKYLSSVEGVIIRNIWPTFEYAQEWEAIERLIIESGLPTFNSLKGNADNKGKEYLVDLYEKGFPVIPSIDSLQNISKLPESDLYWIKPRKGCDGSGAGKYTLEQLSKIDLTDYIIQPFEEFTSEPSFFYINNAFSYAISMPNRLEEKDIKVYEPTQEDLDFAEKFVAWDDLVVGIERIDAVRTKDGRLLLTEDEDIADYLYLLDLDEKTRARIVNEIVEAIKEVFLRN